MCTFWIGDHRKQLLHRNPSSPRACSQDNIIGCCGKQFLATSVRQTPPGWRLIGCFPPLTLGPRAVLPVFQARTIFVPINSLCPMRSTSTVWQPTRFPPSTSVKIWSPITQVSWGFESSNSQGLPEEAHNRLPGTYNQSGVEVVGHLHDGRSRPGICEYQCLVAALVQEVKPIS